MRKRFFQILILSVIGILIASQNSAFADSFDISRGVMPDSVFYSLDIQMEKLQLEGNKNSPDKLADLHYHFSTERLNELEYLAESNKAEINQVIVINTNYQENIQNYAKIITNQPEQKDVDKIVPQIVELQATQNKIVEKINENQVEDKVKVIVKSSIKESQDSLIQALATVSKPAIQNSNQSPNDQNKTKEVTEKLDKTINDLKNSKEEIKEDLKIEETNLKNNSSVAKSTPSTDTAENPIENQAVVKIDKNSVVIEPEIVKGTNTEPIVAEIPANQVAKEYYYSSSCEYVSDKPGKDPVCGGDLVPISTLPPEHSFFSKYIYKDGKYVQNIDELADQKTDNLTNEIDIIIDEINQDSIDSANSPDNQNPAADSVTPTNTDTPVTTNNIF